MSEKQKPSTPTCSTIKADGTRCNAKAKYLISNSPDARENGRWLCADHEHISDSKTTADKPAKA